VNLLRRKTPAETTVTPTTVMPSAAISATDNAKAPKGRPTPKRRSTSVPAPPAPRTRKEAVARHKQQVTQAKASGQKKMTTAEYRDALKSGDPRVLPGRDQGPFRALARDYVDSHRMASNFLLLIFPLTLVGTKIRLLQAVTMVLLFLVFAEWMFTGSRIKRLAAERKIESKESAVTLAFYVGTRAYIPRKWRRPLPRVTIGETI
jgi:hypothetical protein